MVLIEKTYIAFHQDISSKKTCRMLLFNALLIVGYIDRILSLVFDTFLHISGRHLSREVVPKESTDLQAMLNRLLKQT